MNDNVTRKSVSVFSQILLVCGLLVSTLSWSVDWNNLSPQERTLFRRLDLQKVWNTLPEARQQRYRRGARRWLDMNRAQRRHARQRMLRWRRFSAERRARMIRRYRIFRNLPPQEQRRILHIRRMFMRLPPHRRRQLRLRWQRMTPMQRRAVLMRLRNRMRNMEFRHRMRHHMRGLPPHRRRQMMMQWQQMTPMERERYRRRIMRPRR